MHINHFGRETPDERSSSSKTAFPPKKKKKKKTKQNNNKSDISSLGPRNGTKNNFKGETTIKTNITGHYYLFVWLTSVTDFFLVLSIGLSNVFGVCVWADEGISEVGFRVRMLRQKIPRVIRILLRF